jgi:hypothetical protein
LQFARSKRENIWFQSFNSWLKDHTKIQSRPA